jgi:hypothetical protein
MEQVKDKTSGVKLMGFGHRVYKNYDPRAKLMRKPATKSWPNWAWKTIPLFALAKKLEKIALEDDYFVSASSTPTWTSTPASCSAPSASPSTCSPASSLWPAPWAGSLSSTNKWPTPSTRSVVPASCSPAPCRATSAYRSALIGAPRPDFRVSGWQKARRLQSPRAFFT